MGLKPVRLCVLSAFLFILSAFAEARADHYACPKIIAGISNNSFSQEFVKVVKKIYEDLNCKTLFKMMPGNRAIY